MFERYKNLNGEEKINVLRFVLGELLLFLGVMLSLLYNNFIGWGVCASFSLFLFGMNYEQKRLKVVRS